MLSNNFRCAPGTALRKTVGRVVTRSGVLTKRLTTVSQTRPSISAMLSFWVITWAGSLLFAALGVETYVKRRWPSRSTLGLGAVVGLSAILFAFVGIGALVEGALHSAAWLRDDEMALWVGVLCLWSIFVFGALRAIPWVAAQRE